MGSVPLKAMYDTALTAKPRSWNEVEEPFLRAMEVFDANVADGTASMGDLQNGKGDFFNDLLALLLENCAGVSLYARGGVPGLIFANHNLDVTYPNTGVVEFLLEAKAVGTPKHPGSPKQRAAGRPGSADLDKRIKEAAFKTIDLKAEFGRVQTMQGATAVSSPGGNLTTWLRQMRPSSYLFIAARVISDSDFARVEKSAAIAAQVLDHVGVFCFEPVAADKPTTYRTRKVTATAHELERVLYSACQDLAALKATEPIVAPPGLAAEAAATYEDSEGDEGL